jgi:DNA-binding transcriptional LysR family regulator
MARQHRRGAKPDTGPEPIGSDQVVFNTVSLILEAALAGFGIAYLPQDGVQAHLERGDLVRMLDPWCEPFPGDHVYSPSRREAGRALAVLAEALRRPP